MRYTPRPGTLELLAAGGHLMVAARAKPARSRPVTVATPGGLGFPHAQQAVRITRTRTINGQDQP
jgi:hypothetical protein